MINILVTMVTCWFPVAADIELPPINPDNLDPGAAHVCQVTDR